MDKGIITAFYVKRGFGFILPDSAVAEAEQQVEIQETIEYVMFHVTTCAMPAERIRQGAKVIYDAYRKKSTGMLTARWVRLLETAKEGEKENESIHTVDEPGA